MNPNFYGCDGPMRPNFDPRSQSTTDNQPYAALDSQLKRDRYELLSAYIDSELSPTDRKRVEHWLRTDESMKCLYDRLLKLRIGLQAMPIPSENSVEETVAAVCRRVERKKPRRSFVWGGAAIAALFCAVVSSNFNLSLQHATNQVDSDGLENLSVDGLNVSLDKTLLSPGDSESAMGKGVSESALMIAIDQPVIDIPEPTSQLVQSHETDTVQAAEEPMQDEEGTL